MLDIIIWSCCFLNGIINWLYCARWWRLTHTFRSVFTLEFNELYLIYATNYFEEIQSVVKKRKKKDASSCDFFSLAQSRAQAAHNIKRITESQSNVTHALPPVWGPARSKSAEVG